MMKITLHTSQLPTRLDAIILPVYGKGRPAASSLLSPTDRKTVEALRQRHKKADAKHRLTSIPAPSRNYKNILLVEFFGKQDIPPDRIRTVAGEIVKKLDQDGIRSPALAAWETATLSPFLEGIILANYRHDRFKTKPKPSGLKALAVVTPEDTRAIRPTVRQAQILAESENWARDIGNAPGNKMTPSILAEEANRMAEETGCICTVLGEDAMRERGMGCLLGVSRGSREEARLITVEYTHPEATRKLAFVGKGLTFDAGGISLKNPQGMEEMRFDTCGGAAVLGAIRAIALMKLKINIVAVVPSSENLPDGQALKPGDILTASNGKTVEIISTDAEGRLILADALAETIRVHNPDRMVDLATLTGAVLHAVGREYAAVMSRSDALVEALEKAGEDTYERVWRLPLTDDYKDLLKSHNADITNGSSDGAGTIAGGIFLEHFVGKTEWAHVDIAAVAWKVKRVSYWDSNMATGFGTRLLTQWALQEGEREKG